MLVVRQSENDILFLNEKLGSVFSFTNENLLIYIFHPLLKYGQ